ncbi:uncharacterized protein [Palaemon carinicauda]|uniref:uncharacterized protein n=1 Tax=Palaemon carinicauda TaxID=392227 RepID=UPI0035B6032A
MFVYSAPAMAPRAIKPPRNLPMPKVEQNIMFIRTEELDAGLEPIIVPPPQKKHIIYVLNEESGQQGPRLIEITTPPPKNPEVYFVNYADGQTPTLPDGIDFEEALKSAIHAEGMIISGGSTDFDEHDGDVHDLVSDHGINKIEETSVGSAAVSADQRDHGFPSWLWK